MIRAIMLREADMPMTVAVWTPTDSGALCVGWIRHDANTGQWIARTRPTSAFPPVVEACATRVAAAAFLLVATGMAREPREQAA